MSKTVATSVENPQACPKLQSKKLQAPMVEVIAMEA